MARNAFRIHLPVAHPAARLGETGIRFAGKRERTAPALPAQPSRRGAGNADARAESDGGRRRRILRQGEIRPSFRNPLPLPAERPADFAIRRNRFRGGRQADPLSRRVQRRRDHLQKAEAAAAADPQRRNPVRGGFLPAHSGRAQVGRGLLWNASRLCAALRHGNRQGGNHLSAPQR